MKPLQSLFDQVLPRTIVARMTLILFIGILFAQIMGIWIWGQQLKAEERLRISEVAVNMGARIGQTIQFFSRLPHEYRHIVLDQLRDMGGTRFFVSINSQYIPLAKVSETQTIAQVRVMIDESIRTQIKVTEQPMISFVRFEDLRILSGDNMMVNLPPKWQRFALLDPGDDSPVVVVQLKLNNDEWAYLATQFPNGESLYGFQWFTGERLVTSFLISLTILILTTLLVRSVVRPLRLLSRHADQLGRGHSYQFLPVQGSSEMQSTIHAFNSMGQRLQKFIADRERLFASISHDLKTPLTKAKLRIEKLDDTEIRSKLSQDLDDLETMVKASLQMVKDAAIHENTERTDLVVVLSRCVEAAEVARLPYTLRAPESLMIDCRPLSLERLFTNLVDNALHYGRSVDVEAFIDEPQKLVIVKVMDRGPGIPDEQKSVVFEPYFRSGHKPSSVHVGLGLGIAKTIVQLHGGLIALGDRSGGGLVVTVQLPLSHFVTN
jgi:signal transduction histidine kinase